MRLDADRMYLIPPWVSYATASVPGVPHLFVHFDVRGIPAPVVRELFPRPLALAEDPGAVRRLVALGEALCAGIRPDPAQVLAVRSVVDAALADACALLPTTARDRLQAHVLPTGPLGLALGLIDADPAALLGNEALAAHAGCSTDHLIRLFRRHLGQSPARHATERRLTAAARALVETEAPLEVIATAHGFANRFGFTRAFARQFGIPPAQWRRTRGAGGGRWR